MTYLDRQGVSIDGQDYLVMTEGEVGAYNQRTGEARRNWHVRMVPQATKKKSLLNVDETGESGLLVFDDFGRGICGDQRPILGAMHLLEGTNGFTGALKPSLPQTIWGGSGTDIGGNPAAVVEFERTTTGTPTGVERIPFFFNGREVRDFLAVNSAQIDVDFGAGLIPTDAITHNNEIVVGFGGSTNTIRTRNAAGTWTTATDAVYVDHFAKVEDRLWRATATNQVSNIGPTDNPRTLSLWSSGITVGNPTTRINDLNGYGEQLAVSKIEGMLLGDRSAVFPLVLPIQDFDIDNGRQTQVVGDTILFPHSKGLLRYRNGEATEIGWTDYYSSTDLGDNVMGIRPTSLAIQGKYIWAGVETSGYPQADPTGVQSTTNGGTSYTNITANMTDDSWDTQNSFGLDTDGAGAVQRYIIVGYSAAFYGIRWLLVVPGDQSDNATYQYWNGTAWTAIPPEAQLTDRTISSISATRYLSKSGLVTWANQGLSSWAASTINGINAFWVRIANTSAVASSGDPGISASEIRVVTGEPRSYILRGRPPEASDPPFPIIWEPYDFVEEISVPYVLSYFDRFEAAGCLLVAGRNQFAFLRTPNASQLGFFAHSGGVTAVTARHDCGSPELNKQWLNLTVKGRNITSDKDVAIAYRLDYGSSWTTLSSSVTASPTTISFAAGITGRAIQIRVTFNAFTATGETFPEITDIELRYRSLDTMKEEHEVMLFLPVKNHRGGADADIAVAGLNTALRAASVSYIDPARGIAAAGAITANLMDLEILEIYQSVEGFPALACRARLVEV